MAICLADLVMLPSYTPPAAAVLPGKTGTAGLGVMAVMATLGSVWAWPGYWGADWMSFPSWRIARSGFFPPRVMSPMQLNSWPYSWPGPLSTTRELMVTWTELIRLSTLTGGGTQTSHCVPGPGGGQLTPHREGVWHDQGGGRQLHGDLRGPASNLPASGTILTVWAEYPSKRLIKDFRIWG
jgi:hypothetical protein